MKEKSQKDEGLKVTFQVQIALRVHLLGKCGIYPSSLTWCQLDPWNANISIEQ